MAVTFVQRAADGGTTNSDTINTDAPFTTVAGNFYLAAAWAGDDAAMTSGPTISGDNGADWDLVADFAYNSQLNRISLWRFAPTSVISTTTNVLWGQVVNGITIVVNEFSGAATGNNGADAIGNTDVASDISATPNLSLPALADGALVAAHGMHAIWFEGVTWDSPMANRGNLGQSTIGTVFIGTGVDNTPSCSFSGDAWGMLGVELLQAEAAQDISILVPRSPAFRSRGG